MSSIFRIIRTVSAASCTALVDTNSGCTTFSSMMLEMVPCAHGTRYSTVHSVSLASHSRAKVAHGDMALTLRTLMPA